MLMLLNESFGYVLFMLYIGMCALNTCRRSCYICRGPTFPNLSKFLFISRSSDCLSKAYFVMVYPPTTLVSSFRSGSANLILFHCSYVFFSPILNRQGNFFGHLQSHFSYLNSVSRKGKTKGGDTDEFAGEYQTLMEQEFFDFVLYEIPWVTQ